MEREEDTFARSDTFETFEGPTCDTCDDMNEDTLLDASLRDKQQPTKGRHAGTLKMTPSTLLTPISPILAVEDGQRLWLTQGQTSFTKAQLADFYAPRNRAIWDKENIDPRLRPLTHLNLNEDEDDDEEDDEDEGSRHGTCKVFSTIERRDRATGSCDVIRLQPRSLGRRHESPLGRAASLLAQPHQRKPLADITGRVVSSRTSQGGNGLEAPPLPTPFQLGPQQQSLFDQAGPSLLSSDQAGFVIFQDDRDDFAE